MFRFASGYGDNALKCKKCEAQRIAFAMAECEGWLTYPCRIVGLAAPEGKEECVAADF